MLTYFSKRIQPSLYAILLAVATGLILGVSVVYATPLVVTISLITVFIAFLVLKMPEIGIVGYLILLSTIFNSAANIGISLPFGHIYLSDILLVAILLLILLRSLVESDFNIVHTPLDLPLLLFVGLAFLSTFAAINYSSLTLQQSLAEMRVVASYLLFFAATNLIRKKSQLSFLVRSIIILGALVSIVMMIQYVLGPSAPRLLSGRVEVLSTEGSRSASVTRIIPPGDSLILVGFIILLVVLLFEEANSRNLILLIPAVLMAFGILLTFKRHYWAAVLLIALILIYLGRRRNLQNVLIGGFTLLIFGSVTVFYMMFFTGSTGPQLVSGSVTRFMSLVDPQTYTDPNSSLRWRDFEDQYALPQIAAHPLLGLGLGARYRPLIPPRDWAGFDGRTFIHNAHLWLLVKTGFLGYLPLLWMFILSLYRGFKYWRLVPNPRESLYVLGFTLAMMGMLIGSWVEPTLMEAPWTPVIGLVMGINEYIFSGLDLKNPAIEHGK